MRGRPVMLVAAVVILCAVAACGVQRPGGTADLPASGRFIDPATQSPAPSLVPSPSPSMPPPTPTPTATKVRAPLLPTLRAPSNPDKIKVSGTTLFGWALYDRDTHKTAGSRNDATVRNTVESMVKPWIASDYLRRLASAGETPRAAVLSDIKLMIIDSNDHIAQEYWNLGGHDAVMNRMISICKLTDVTPKHDLWSWALMTPLDASRYGECIADGRAAGPKWTAWILEAMTEIRGDIDDQETDKEGGRWGIIDGLPDVLADTLSFKNGWTLYVDGWHVNCLAINPRWVLAVEVHASSLKSSAAVCASVARQLVVTH